MNIRALYNLLYDINSPSQSKMNTSTLSKRFSLGSVSFNTLAMLSDVVDIERLLILLVNTLEFETVLDTNAGEREDVARTVEETLKAETPDE